MTDSFVRVASPCPLQSLALLLLSPSPCAPQGHAPPCSVLHAPHFAFLLATGSSPQGRGTLSVPPASISASCTPANLPQPSSPCVSCSLTTFTCLWLPGRLISNPTHSEGTGMCLETEWVPFHQECERSVKNSGKCVHLTDRQTKA